MTNSRGFILPTGMTLYIAIGAALVIAGLGVALKVQSSRLEAKTAQYDGFVAQVKAIGEVQETETKRVNEKYLEIVKEKDNENLIVKTKLAVVTKRLRDNNTSSSLVPTNPTSSRSPNLSCYDRIELDSALRSFTGGTEELIIEGQSSAIDLNTGKEWVKSLSK